MLTIADAGTDAYLGFVSLTMKPARVGEIGYMVVPAARGRGLARAALAVFAQWTLRGLGLPRVQLSIDPANTPSLRVAEACGFVREGLLRSAFEVRGRRVDTVVFSRLPSD